MIEGPVAGVGLDEDAASTGTGKPLAVVETLRAWG